MVYYVKNNFLPVIFVIFNFLAMMLTLAVIFQMQEIGLVEKNNVIFQCKFFCVYAKMPYSNFVSYINSLDCNEFYDLKMLIKNLRAKEPFYLSLHEAYLISHLSLQNFLLETEIDSIPLYTQEMREFILNEHWWDYYTERLDPSSYWFQRRLRYLRWEMWDYYYYRMPPEYIPLVCGATFVVMFLQWDWRLGGNLHRLIWHGGGFFCRTISFYWQQLISGIFLVVLDIKYKKRKESFITYFFGLHDILDTYTSKINKIATLIL